MAIIIGGGDNAYFFNPENPRDTSNKVKPDTGFIAAPASPAPEDQLQFLIDNKNKLTGVQGVNPDLNAYQEAIQDFRTSDPMNMAAYADRFPMTNFMMNIPNIIADNTLFGQVISALGSGKDKAKEFASGLFPQGFMPGLDAEVDRFTTQLAAAPGEFKEDFVKMFTKDDEPTKAVLREDFDIKKNTSEDIVEGSLFKDTEVQTNVPFTNELFYGGRSPSDDFAASLTTPGSSNLNFGRQFFAMNQTPEFAKYIDRVEKSLGIQ